MESNDGQSKAEDEPDKYDVCIRFFGDDLDPNEVSQLLGSSPTGSERLGDLIPSRIRSRTARTGSWRLATEQSSDEIEEQLVALFGRLTADLAVWQSLTTPFEADIFCGVFHVYQSHHVVFSPRLHPLLADRNLPLILDIYASDRPNERQSFRIATS